MAPERRTPDTPGIPRTTTWQVPGEADAGAVLRIVAATPQASPVTEVRLGGRPIPFTSEVGAISVLIPPDAESRRDTLRIVNALGVSSYALSTRAMSPTPADEQTAATLLPSLDSLDTALQRERDEALDADDSTAQADLVRHQQLALDLRSGLAELSPEDRVAVAALVRRLMLPDLRSALERLGTPGAANPATARAVPQGTGVAAQVMSAQASLAATPQRLVQMTYTPARCDAAMRSKENGYEQVLRSLTAIDLLSSWLDDMTKDIPAGTATKDVAKAVLRGFYALKYSSHAVKAVQNVEARRLWVPRPAARGGALSFLASPLNVSGVRNANTSILQPVVLLVNAGVPWDDFVMYQAASEAAKLQLDLMRVKHARIGSAMRTLQDRFPNLQKALRNEVPSQVWDRTLELLRESEAAWNDRSDPSRVRFAEWSGPINVFQTEGPQWRIESGQPPLFVSGPVTAAERLQFTVSHRQAAPAASTGCQVTPSTTPPSGFQEVRRVVSVQPLGLRVIPGSIDVDAGDTRTQTVSLSNPFAIPINVSLQVWGALPYGVSVSFASSRVRIPPGTITTTQVTLRAAPGSRSPARGGSLGFAIIAQSDEGALGCQAVPVALADGGGAYTRRGTIDVRVTGIGAKGEAQIEFGVMRDGSARKQGTVTIGENGGGFSIALESGVNAPYVRLTAATGALGSARFDVVPTGYEWTDGSTRTLLPGGPLTPAALTSSFGRFLVTRYSGFPTKEDLYARAIADCHKLEGR